MIAVIVIEGVLSEGDLKTANAYKWAKPMYDALRSQFNLMLLSSADRDIATWWLRKERMSDWSSLQVWNPKGFFTYPDWCADQIRGFLSDGWEIAIYLDFRPDVVAAVSGLGVATLQVSYPSLRPGWKDDSPPRSWSDVVTTVEAKEFAEG